MTLQVRQQRVRRDRSADQEQRRWNVFQTDLDRIRLENGGELQREEIEKGREVHPFQPKEGQHCRTVAISKIIEYVLLWPKGKGVSTYRTQMTRQSTWRRCSGLETVPWE
jgi:hypothetical protein